MSDITLTLDGLEALVERVVEEKLAAALTREPDRWLSSDEAAAYLGIARSTLHDLVSAGQLPRLGAKGSRLRFRREDLDAYAKRG